MHDPLCGCTVHCRKKIDSQSKIPGRYIFKIKLRPCLSRPYIFFQNRVMFVKTMWFFSRFYNLVQFDPVWSNSIQFDPTWYIHIWYYMAKTCKLMMFFIIVHKNNNNNKVTLRTLVVNAPGQKEHFLYTCRHLQFFDIYLDASKTLWERLQKYFINLFLAFFSNFHLLHYLKCCSYATYYHQFVQLYVLVRAANSKLFGTKILELPKPFRVQTWKYLKNFSEVRTYLNSKFEFQVFLSLLEKTLTHFLLLFDIIKRNVWSSSKFFSLYS